MKNFLLGGLITTSLILCSGHAVYASTNNETIYDKGYQYYDDDIRKLLNIRLRSKTNIKITECIRTYTDEYYSRDEVIKGQVKDRIEKKKYDVIVMPLNTGGHWVGIILEVDRNSNNGPVTAHILNSGSENESARDFLNNYVKKNIENRVLEIKEAPNVWKQKDGSSCGGYMVENIANFLDHKSDEVTDNADSIRKYHGKLLKISPPKPDQPTSQEAQLSKTSREQQPNHTPNQQQNNQQQQQQNNQQQQQNSSVLPTQVDKLIKIQKISNNIRTSPQAMEVAIKAITSVMSQNIDTRMSSITSNNEKDGNIPKAAGSEIIDVYAPKKSWDAWAKVHLGLINQDSVNKSGATSKTNLYGITIGADKLFGNNNVFGIALSCSQSNTKYNVPQDNSDSINENWESGYYQANLYTHYNVTNHFFLEAIGGLGRYGNNTKIQNLFSSSQDHTFGYHVSTTIGYSSGTIGSSKITLTPTLRVLYYHLDVPNSTSSDQKSSEFTTLNRVDGVIGTTIKLVGLNLKNNFIVTPELIAGFRFRLYDNIGGPNADELKLPKVEISDRDDLLSNILVSPAYVLQLGGGITLSKGNNAAFGIHVNVDFASKYLAVVGNLGVKLSF